MIDVIRQDIRYAIRNLVKTPGFLVVAILTLALGIGANTAMFGVVKAVLLASLPYPRPAQLVQIWETGRNGHQMHVSRPNFLDWHAQNGSMQALAYGYADVVTATGIPTPERLHAGIVSADFFQVYAVSPEVGRTTMGSEHRPGASGAVVISHALWQRQFGGDPRVLNRAIDIAGVPFNIVGVMPLGFDFPEHADVWYPIELFPDPSTRSAHNYEVFGRLRDGVSESAAQADLTRIAADLAQRYPEDKDHSARVVSLYEQIVGPVRPALLILLAAVGFVLLIACVNLANLQLARGSARVKEMALRTALGAVRGRLVRQLMTESILVGLAGGIAGLLLALWATVALRAAIPANIPRVENIQIDGAVLAFTLGISVLAGIFFGVLPAFSGSRIDVSDALKEGSGKATLSAGHRRMGNVLVTAEIALAMVLLVGAGLLIRTFWNLEHVDPGFSTTGVAVSPISWPFQSEAFSASGKVVTSTRLLLDRIRQIPGVDAAAVTTTLPIQDGGVPDGYFEIAGRPLPADPNQYPDAGYITVSSDYFAALRIPLIKGRVFNADDERAGIPQSAVVNRAFVKQFFPNEDPIGRTIKFLGMELKPEPLQTVGVVGDVRSAELARPPGPEVFVNAFQNPGRIAYVTLVVRSGPGAISGITPSVTQTIASVNRDVPVKFASLNQVLGDSVARQRFQMTLLAVFAGLALLLAAVGIYGVQSYTVTRRTSELGIRLALGADRGTLLGMVLREGLGLTAAGLGIGIVGAVLLTRTLESLLFGVSATDPTIMAAVALVLSVVAMLACYLPARRAAATDPLVALRYE